MTMLDQFTPGARQAVIKAGLQAAGAGNTTLGPEFLLLALADDRPLAGRPAGLGIDTVALRGRIARRQRRPSGHRDDELLASLGIDAEDVRRRALDATGVRLDDPARWTLRRSRLRPLRLTLNGPARHIFLSGRSRKVIEVATWARRRGHRSQADREDLLWGLLADQSGPAVRALSRLDFDVRALWTDLRSWNASAGRG